MVVIGLRQNAGRPVVTSAGSTYIFAGGGTAGHINPALSVAAALRNLDPQAEILFFVSPEGLESELVAQAGFAQTEINCAAIPLQKTSYPKFFLQNYQGYREARKLLKQKPVKAVLGTGGFVSFPLLMAAHKEGIPSFMHEQNAYPGRANRFLSRYCQAICLTFPGSEKFFPENLPGSFVLTGNPIHPDFFLNKQESVRAQLQVSEDCELVVAVGGSLGARSLNLAVEGLVAEEKWQDFLQAHPNFLLVLSTGKVNYRFLQSQESPDPHIRYTSYLDTKVWLPAADLLIGRSSAGFLSESAAAAKASILVPFPQAAEDHQTANAQVFLDRGASVLVKDDQLDSRRLLAVLQELLADKPKLQAMSQAAGSLAKPQAAETLAGLMYHAHRED